MTEVFRAGYSRNEDDVGGRISRQDVPARGRAIQMRHIVVHEDNVRTVAVIGLDRFETRADYFDDFVFELGNESGQRRADGSLVISYQHAHGHFCRTFHATASIIEGNFIEASGVCGRSLFEIGKEPGEQAYKWKKGTDLKDKRNAGAVRDRPQQG